MSQTNIKLVLGQYLGQEIPNLHLHDLYVRYYDYRMDQLLYL